MSLPREEDIEILRELGVTLVVTVASEFYADSVAGWCATELGAPAVRVEIAHRFRAPNRNGADYRRLFRALATAVEHLR